MGIPHIEWPPRTMRRIPLGFVPSAASSDLTLTEEQRFVAEQLATARRVTLVGCSGSGKTHLATAFARGTAAIGRRVLVLCPRKPLSMWLRQALDRHGVDVQTIDASMKAAMSERWSAPPVRQGFDDRAFFEAAIEAVRPGRYDLIVAEEWQTTSDLERSFIAALAGERSLVALEDPSRDLLGQARSFPGDGPALELSEGFRSPNGVGVLDRLYANDGLDPLPTPFAAACVRTSVVSDPEDVQSRVLEAVEGIRKRGFALGEVGVVSGQGRPRSALATALCAPRAGMRGYLLTEAPGMTGLACDSFAYWLGLERRAIILAEFPGRLSERRRRMHIALSRACEEVHLVLPRADLEQDPALTGWMASGPTGT